MKVKHPLVSLIITSYNYERYLRQSIDSALNQTYSNTEVIVVDDGSTDNSREILESYKDKIIPIYKRNGGPASAFNAGFAVSQGEIVCLLDADDVWLPQKVEKVVKAFDTYSKAVVTYHKIQNIDQVGKPFSKPWPPYKVIRGNISSQVAQTGGWWPFPPTSALSFRREFLCKVMPMPEKEEEYKVWVDCYLADLAPFLGEVVGINQVLSNFRLHDSNNWSNPIGVPEDVRATHELQDHEFRVSILNRGLKRLGLDLEVSLADHWPYQLLKYRRDHKVSLLALSRLALRNPWEHRLVSRLKTVALLWLERGSLSRI
jgi:glycosyltransferase involved in cell wall biosynthesis